MLYWKQRWFLVLEHLENCKVWMNLEGLTKYTGTGKLLHAIDIHDILPWAKACHVVRKCCRWTRHVDKKRHKSSIGFFPCFFWSIKRDERGYLPYFVWMRFLFTYVICLSLCVCVFGIGTTPLNVCSWTGIALPTSRTKNLPALQIGVIQQACSPFSIRFHRQKRVESLHFPALLDACGFHCWKRRET